MKIFICKVFLSLIIFSNISCKDELVEQTQPLLDSIYQKLEKEYANGERSFGKYQYANICNDLEFEFFTEKVVVYVKYDMRKDLAGLIKYPLSIQIYEQNKTLLINDKKEFLKHYDILMTEYRIKMLLDQNIFSDIDTINQKKYSDDNRVLLGNRGEITYTRSNERGKESYVLKNLF